MLARCINDADADVRADVAFALGNFGGLCQKTLPVMDSLWCLREDTDLRVQKSASKAIDRINARASYQGLQRPLPVRMTFALDFKTIKKKLLGIKGKVSTSVSNSRSPFYKCRFPASIPEGALTQQDFKSMLPPKAYIWMGSAGSWQSHIPPHRRFSQSWSVTSHREAGLNAVRDCWLHYLSDNCMDTSSCPIPGLF